MESECIFCLIRDNRAPAEIVWNEFGIFGIKPINPVAPGHVLIIPDDHISDFSVSPSITANVMFSAAEYVKRAGMSHANIITSRGAYATQTVFHLHVHVVPRTRDDGLHLPWTEND